VRHSPQAPAADELRAAESATRVETGPVRPFYIRFVGFRKHSLDNTSQIRAKVQAKRKVCC
jgi:hypothetical protein